MTIPHLPFVFAVDDETPQPADPAADGRPAEPAAEAEPGTAAEPAAEPESGTDPESATEPVDPAAEPVDSAETDGTTEMFFVPTSYADVKTLYKGNVYVSAGTAILAAIVLGVVVDVIVRRVFKQLAKRTTTELDDVFVAAVRKPLFWSITLAGVGIALKRLGPPETATYIVEGILLTFVVLMWAGAGFTIGRTVLTMLSNSVDQVPIVNARTMPLFEIVVKMLLVAGAAYGILLAWHVDLTAWLASAGILGIAIGFAAKDTLANFFSGIFILADAPYKIGDFIVLGTGERGRVTDIGIRSTRILTRDDIEITVPNAAIANAKIINESGGPYDMERVRVTIGVAYGSDIDQIRDVLMDVADKSTYLVKDPTPRVRFRTFDDSCLTFQLMGWIEKPVLRGRALDELNAMVYKRFMAEGIEIPFPQRDVHLHKVE